MLKENPDNQFQDIGGIEGLLAAYQQGIREFSQANLENANLSQADLSGINLSQANLRGANLTETNLSEADLSGADLQGANLNQTNLRDANLSGSDLRQAVLKQVNLYRANLSWANLINQDLSDANLERVDLQGANLSAANLSKANLKEAKLDAANLSAAILTNAVLNDAYMARVQLVRANLRQADLVNANLTLANLEQSTLERANLARARLRKANLKQANLKQAYLRHCNLQQANLTSTNLQKADLADTKLDEACLTQADLRGAEIDPAKQANLAGAILGEPELAIKHHLHLELKGKLNISFAFSPDSEMLAYTDWDTKVTLVNTHTGQQIIKIDTQVEPIVSVVFSADGKTLHHSFYLNELKLWNPSTGELIHHLKNHSANITALAFNGNAEIVGMVGTGEPFEVFDLGHETRTFRGYSSGILTQAQSPDGRFTAKGGADLEGRIELLDRRTGQIIRVFTGHKAAVQSLAFRPDSKLLASTSEDDEKMWQVETGKEIYNRKNRINAAMYYYSPSIAFIQTDSSEIPVLMSSYLYSNFEHSIAIQSREKGVEFDWYGGGGGWSSIGYATLSADRKVLARADDDQPIQLWNLQTNEELGAINLNSKDFYAISLSPTGNLLAVKSERGQEFTLWDVETKTAIKTFPGHSTGTRNVIFSPDGQMLASIGRNATIKLWNLQTGDEIQTLRAYSSVDALTFHPFEPILTSGSRDGIIKLWDLNTMEEIHSFRGHNQDVTGLKFSPDGKWLASSGDEKLVRLWEFKPGFTLSS